MIIIPRETFIIMFFMITRIHSFAQISIHHLLGRWEMQTIYVDGTEVTSQYISNEKRWIDFNSDFTFISDGELYGKKEGTFTLDEGSGLLSFDLDLGFGEQSFWYVEFDGQKMIWTDRGNPKVAGIKIILVNAY